jgi:uncharacterized protein (DUF2147 family)
MQFKRLSRIEFIGAVVLAAAALAPLAARGQQPRPAVAPAPPLFAGIWIDHTGRGAVEILPCAEALCGRIVWLKEPNDKAGQPFRDVKNEDRAKRAQPICGLQILGNLKLQPDGSWDHGWIYDPEQGERFDVELRLRGPDMLQVKGYKGLKFLSETYQWKRPTAPPSPLCAS